MTMPDPSSPSTISARDAVVEAMYQAGIAAMAVDGHAICDAMLDAALGVTYTTLCPTCGGSGYIGYALVSDVPGGPTPAMSNAMPCPSCNGSGRSAPRLALIDVLVASGALEGK